MEAMIIEPAKTTYEAFLLMSISGTERVDIRLNSNPLKQHVFTVPMIIRKG